MVTVLGKASEMRHMAGLRAAPLVPVPPQSRDGRKRLEACGKTASVANESSRYARTASGAYCSTSGAGFSTAPSKRLSKRLARSADLWTSRKEEAEFAFVAKKELRQQFSLGTLADDGEVVLVELPSDGPESASPLSGNVGIQGVIQGLSDGTKVVKLDASSIPAGMTLTPAENDSSAAVLALERYQPRLVWFAKSAAEENLVLNKAINAAILAFAGCFSLTTVFTVDHEYWHGWTLKEILQYAPQHNWEAYEALLKSNPILAKMMISGTVYSLGDWIAQCFEGKSALEFDRMRMFRSGIVGFCLHGSMSHFYYRFCEWLFPFQGWWVLPLKVAFDQTAWSGLWNSIYFTTLGLLRLESPANVWTELRTTFFPLLTAGWKLWPFAHLVTYGIIPVEQRLLWVDMVEIIWVTILALYSNKTSEARIHEHEELDIIRANEKESATGEAQS